jgi:hypothetical protein
MEHNEQKKEPTQKRLKTKGQNKAFARKNFIGRFNNFELDFNKISEAFDDVLESDEFRDSQDEAF